MEAMFDILTNYFIPFVVVLTVVVFVHEYGHYWVARRCGVKIETFSIGFGPELFGWTDSHGTRWKFSAVPLGGYVKMFGDADPASTPDAAVKTMTDTEKSVAFYHKSVNRRAAIVFAGPAANYIFAIIVLAFLFALAGQPFTPPVAGDVLAGEPAAKAGMQKGDRVLAIDGSPIERFEDIQRIISVAQGQPVSLKVLRGEAEISIKLTPAITKVKDHFGNEHTAGRIGLASTTVEIKKLPPGEALIGAARETWHMTAVTLKALGQMIAGTRDSEELGGVLRIAKMSGDVASQKSSASFFWFVAVLSINLGLINLFPVPLLDGGHLLFYAAEKLRGRPLSDRLQEAGARVGLALVLSLMLFATWNDLVQLQVVSYLKGLFS
ncbi:MAG: RIP metalloprotease RseP [Alphaproteobacteria bacterium]|nr:RIP metalloprotease RseP [Alphaproteobacteria bacterium]